jgi:hypothetical protein
MKKYGFIILTWLFFFMLPFRLLAQEDISGLWKGTLYDDTTKEYLLYEIAISNHRGKLTGYSYTVFKGSAGDEMGVKTICIRRKEDKVIIEDVALIDNTYKVAVSNRVRKRIDLTLTVKDSIMLMAGSWRIYSMKEYLPESGKIEIHRKNDFWREEPLIKKLGEMKLSDDLSFVRTDKKQNSITNDKPTEIIAASETKQEIAITDKPNEKGKEETKGIAMKDSSAIATTNPEKEKQDDLKKQDTIENKPRLVQNAAADAYKRKTQIIQSVYFKTDSLVFTLYDNGIVDGDIVSILMNGNLVFAKQELTEKPVSKTIYTKDISDSSMLILYAENLGSIPPNTGLLLIYDGKTRYEIFFSADLETNAAVILRRKKE